MFAGLIAFSWWSAEINHTDWHIWSGIGILTLLIFRLLWGFFGSSTARFSPSFAARGRVRDYLRGDWRGMGHTPLGALSILALLAVVAIQVGLGLFKQDEDGIYAGPLDALVSSDTSDNARDFTRLVLRRARVVALHIAAILFYRVARGKKLTKPMITGKAMLAPGRSRCGRANGGSP